MASDDLRLSRFELRTALPAGARLLAYFPGRIGQPATFYAVPPAVGGGPVEPEPEDAPDLVAMYAAIRGNTDPGTLPFGSAWPDFRSRYTARMNGQNFPTAPTKVGGTEPYGTDWFSFADRFAAILAGEAPPAIVIRGGGTPPFDITWPDFAGRYRSRLS